MLTRIEDFFAFLTIKKRDRQLAIQAATFAGEKARGMTNVKDYETLAAIALHYRPRRIFEIGTYLGVTSDFFLSLLPECEVVSIAYTRPLLSLLGPHYNNSELKRDEIGTEVAGVRRSRFTQLYGDSHKLQRQSLIRTYGYFDLVFIDGDHSSQGVSLDTELAKSLITPSGVICWHDANPKPRYMDVREFLENKLPLSGIATTDDYVGGIAAWSREIEERLNSHAMTADNSHRRTADTLR